MLSLAGFLFVGLSSGEVPTVEIAPGVNLPMVSAGTGSGIHSDVTDVAKVTSDWLTVGGRGIDTAWGYRDEPQIAVGLQRAGVSLSEIFLTTKIPCQKTYQAAAEKIQSNLEQLQVAQVNLTIIHSPGSCSPAQIAETYRALEDAQAAGKTLAIGVSNFEIHHFEALAKTQRVAPALNQYSHSVKYHNDELIAYSAAKGIVHMSFSPLCGGFNGSSCQHGNVLKLPILEKMGAAHGKSSAQVALKWVVQHGFPLTTATDNSKYMAQDLDLWSWGDLTDEEMATLDALADTEFVL